MNILQAKQEIKTAIKAYLMKDDNDRYAIPVTAQRPDFTYRASRHWKNRHYGADCQRVPYRTCGLHNDPPYPPERYWPSHDRQPYLWGENLQRHSEIARLCVRLYGVHKKTEGILFLDEINCVSETLAPTMLQFLQKKNFGSHKIPHGWIIVAAGNPPEYNKSVRNLISSLWTG